MSLNLLMNFHHRFAELMAIKCLQYPFNAISYVAKAPLVMFMARLIIFLRHNMINSYGCVRSLVTHEILLFIIHSFTVCGLLNLHNLPQHVFPSIFCFSSSPLCLLFFRHSCRQQRVWAWRWGEHFVDWEALNLYIWQSVSALCETLLITA